jgi:cytochrome oxidase assembly protein ShyY1
MRKIPIISTIVVLAAAATMVGLGVWQLQRAEWKNALIERYGANANTPGIVSWPKDDSEVEDALYRVSIVDCVRVLEVNSRAASNASGEPGWGHYADCELDRGGRAEIGIGWSLEAVAPEWKGGMVDGVVAPGNRLIASDAVGIPIATPDPNDLPNNHLAYAVQWFFFALTALVIYGLALRKRWLAQDQASD